MVYNHTYTRLIIGLADASLIILPIPAETSLDDEEEVDQAKDRNEEE